MKLLGESQKRLQTCKLLTSQTLKFLADQSDHFFSHKSLAHFWNVEFKKSDVELCNEAAPLEVRLDLTLNKILSTTFDQQCLINDI